MNIQLSGNSMFGLGGSSILRQGGLKSVQEKQQRQAERDDKITFYENQKADLKNMECDSLEEISEKLNLYHSYEDQISAIKAEYNHSQMMHAMDEAIERGEQMAEAAKKHAPKSAEERKEEVLEEALATDESGGLLTEIIEELAELEEELKEAAEMDVEELAESMEDAAADELEDLTALQEEELEGQKHDDN